MYCVSCSANIVSHSMCPISDVAPLKVTLYTKEEVHVAINKLKKKNDKYTRLLLHKDIVDVPDEQTELTETYQNCWKPQRKTQKQIDEMLVKEEKSSKDWHSYQM